MFRHGLGRLFRSRIALRTLEASISATTAAAAAAKTGKHRLASFRGLSVKSPGSDPLDILRKECLEWNLCDAGGCRLPGVHWTLSVAITPEDVTKCPNLRTVGIERVSSMGIDFVMKHGSYTAERIADGAPVSILNLQGSFLPGEKTEQWRGEGSCRTLPLMDVLDLVPHYTVTSIVGSKRLAAEYSSIGEQAEHDDDDDDDDDYNNDGVSLGRLLMRSKSHMTEVMQKTRIELENGDIPIEELEESIRAFRFVPERVECMFGSPDNTVMWERWEWLREQQEQQQEEVYGAVPSWSPPKHLVPH